MSISSSSLSPSLKSKNHPNVIPAAPSATSPRHALGNESCKNGDQQGNMGYSLLGECYRGLSELQEAMNLMDETGLRLTRTLSNVLKDSIYKYVGDAIATRMADVYTCTKSKASLDIVNEMGSMLMKLQDLERQQKLDLDTCQHTLCHFSLLMIKLKRQYYSACSNRVADLVHSLLCLKGEEPAAGEVTKLVLKLGLADGLESPAKSNSSLPNSPWGSPKSRNKLLSSSKSSPSQQRPGFRIMSLFERKSQSEERSSFYVDVDEESSNSSSSSKNQNQISASLSHTNASTATAEDKNVSSVSKKTLTATPTSEDKKNSKIAIGSTNSCSQQNNETQPQPLSDVSMSSWTPPQPPPLPSSSTSLLASVSDEKISSSSNNNMRPLNFLTAAATTAISSSVDNETEPAFKLASEEDLESIINLLSGMGPTDMSPMQAIPEVPLPNMQGGPIQLVVPPIYRLPSPASDSQVDELRSPSRQHQAHRRSEGCLDLSSMRPSSLHHHNHHQQQHHLPPPPPHLQQQQQQLQQQQQHHPPPPRFINTQQPPPPLGAAVAANLNLPWVQIQSASSQGSLSAGSIISDCPSPLSGYTAGDSSPGYAMSPSPSFPSSPARLPVSGGGSTSVGGGGGAPNSLSVGGGSMSMSSMRGRSLSPFQHHHPQQQQWGGVGSGGGSGGGGMFLGGSGGGAPVSPGGTATAPGAMSLSGGGGGGSSPRLALTPEFGPRKQGTWPLAYGGVPTANQMSMGWSGIQDSSDLSDDSSTEDQFFHVGTDLCHALDSKGDSSDEEGYSGHPGQAKNSSTWPLPNVPAGVSDVLPNRGLTPDLLEPPDLYHQQSSHRPVQMQWSDPMSSRSEWPARSLDPSQRKTSQSMYGFGGMP